MQGKELKRQLESLISEANSIDPILARRLDEIDRWIKDKKDGELTANSLLSAFLLQMIRDARIFLKIKIRHSQEERQEALDRLTPTERYWYSYLFPKWLNENDPKFYIWKQKLMAGDFIQSDEAILKALSLNIIRRGGTIWQCYIADLSMATDLVVSGRQGKPLCIQITSVSDEYSQDKYENWCDTLKQWNIDRGLFLSYNPGETNFMNQLVNLAFYNSDNLPSGRYLKFS